MQSLTSQIQVFESEASRPYALAWARAPIPRCCKAVRGGKRSSDAFLPSDPDTPHGICTLADC